jgi:hypothetical protein
MIFCALYDPRLNLDRRTLSSHALDALKSFYTERDARTEQFEQLKAQAERRAAGSAKHVEDGPEDQDADGAGGIGTTEPLSMSVFAEDWNESQFWVCLGHAARILH